MRSQRQASLHPSAILLMLGLLTIACSTSTAPDSHEDDEFLLVRLNGHSLPWLYLEILNSQGHTTGCWAAATEGQLKLNGFDRLFRFSSLFRSTCTGLVLWEGTTRGSFLRNGNNILFTVQDVGNTISFSGTAWQDSVHIEFPDPFDGTTWISHYARRR